MGGDDDDIVTLSAMHNAQHAAAMLDDPLVGSQKTRLSPIGRNRIRCTDRCLDPLDGDVANGDRFSGMGKPSM
jgi:hypothetical protein